VNEHDLADEIRQVLDDGLDRMDGETRARLHAARRQVLNSAFTPDGRGGALALARQHHRIVLALLAGALFLTAWFMLRPEPLADGGDLDILLLTDDIPPQIYADWRLVRREDVGPLCLTVN
jgi:hypothetical protein